MQKCSIKIPFLILVAIAGIVYILLPQQTRVFAKPLNAKQSPDAAGRSIGFLGSSALEADALLHALTAELKTTHPKVATTPVRDYERMSEAELFELVRTLRARTNEQRNIYAELSARRRISLEQGETTDANRLYAEMMTVAQTRVDLNAELTRAAFEQTCRQLDDCNDDTRKAFFGRFQKNERVVSDSDPSLTIPTGR
jgi:hypothetical protein